MIAKVVGVGLVVLIAAGLVFSKRGNRAQVEYDFQTLPYPLRVEAWNTYEHGSKLEKAELHDRLALFGYDAAARHFA